MSTRSQERGRGHWPDCLDQLWTLLIGRHGRSDAARQMVDDSPPPYGRRLLDDRRVFP